MAKQVLTNIDMTKNQILRLVLEKVAQAPADVDEGQLWYDTSTGKAYVRTGNKNEVLNEDKLTNEEIVELVNNSSTKIDRSQVNNLTDEDIVNSINSALTKIEKGQVEGLEELVESVMMSGRDIIDQVNADESTAVGGDPLKIIADKLDLSPAITHAEEQASTAETRAKEYADQRVASLIGDASEDADTLAEIEALIKANKEDLDLMATVTHKYKEVIGDGVALEHTISHELGTRDVVVSIRRNSAPYDVVLADIEIVDDNAVLIRTATPVADESFKVVVIG